MYEDTTAKNSQRESSGFLIQKIIFSSAKNYLMQNTKQVF